MLRVRHGASFLVFCIAGCPNQAPPQKSGPADAKPAKASAAKTPAGKGAPTGQPPAAKPSVEGKVLPTAPIPLGDFLGAAPEVAEGFLGEPVSKGGKKESCLRFVPAKTWFKCINVWQRYADKTGTAKVIHVTYEDKKAASIAFDGLTGGSGPFNPKAALALVGLDLGNVPKLSRPADDVKLWAWWNADARLMIGGRQYRVEVSTVGDSWETGKVELILNDPLNDDEKTRVFEVKPQRPGPPPATP